jgi:hypothetical protein
VPVIVEAKDFEQWERRQDRVAGVALAASKFLLADKKRAARLPG